MNDLALPTPPIPCHRFFADGIPHRIVHLGSVTGPHFPAVISGELPPLPLPHQGVCWFHHYRNAFGPCATPLPGLPFYLPHTCTCELDAGHLGCDEQAYRGGPGLLVTSLDALWRDGFPQTAWFWQPVGTVDSFRHASLTMPASPLLGVWADDAPRFAPDCGLVHNLRLPTPADGRRRQHPSTDASPRNHVVFETTRIPTADRVDVFPHCAVADTFKTGTGG